jgi:predicted PurR-regulated permease PerM
LAQETIPEVKAPISAHELASQTDGRPSVAETIVMPAVEPTTTIQMVEATTPGETTDIPPPLAPASRDAPPNTFSYPSAGTMARWLLVLAALYGVGWLLWQASPALIPFVIGLVLAYLLTPIVNRLDRGMPRWLAILIVYLGGIALIAGAITFIVPPVIQQTEQAITGFPDVSEIRDFGQRMLEQYQLRVPDAIRGPIDANIDNVLNTLKGNLGKYAQRFGTFLANSLLQIINTITFLVGFLIIPIWLFYILNDQDEGKAFLNQVLHPRIRPDFWNVWGIINRVFSDYIRGQLLLGLAIGSMVGIGLLILRLIGFEVRYILLLSILAGITELIPIIGPIIGAIPAVILGFLAPVSPVSTGLIVLALYVIVQQAENNFLVPRIIGESVGVHPAILIVLLIAMGQVFGLLGVILSAPLAAIARDLFLYIYRRLGGQSPDATMRSISSADKDRSAPKTAQPSSA